MKENVGISEKITFLLNGKPIEPGEVPPEPVKPEPEEEKHPPTSMWEP